MSDDNISRQAAIEALDKRFDSIPMEQTTEILMLRRDLRELPPAPERTETLLDNGTLMLECDADLSKVTRVNVRQRGTHSGDLYYPDDTIYAHWIERDEYYECSHCGLAWALNDGTPKENEMYYCPKCKAHMIEEVDE